MRDVNMNPIRSVDRSIDILLAFSVDQPALTIEELASITGIPNSTVYRILCTLERRGMVYFDKKNTLYKPGLRLFALSSLTPYVLDVHKEAEEYLDDLYAKTEQTIIMAVPDGEQILYVYKKEKNHGLKFSSFVGQRRPYIYGVLGPMILAFMPDKDIQSILEEPISKHTPHTLADRNALWERLKKIQNEKLFEEADETTVGVTGVSAPIFNVNGEIAAAIGALGPSIHIEDQLEEIKPMITETSRLISSQMGYGM